MKKTKFCLLIKIAFLCLLLLGAACTNKAQKLQTHLDNGRKYLAAGQVKTAIIELKNATQLAPKNAQAHYLLGKALLKNKEGKAAFRELSIASSLAPDNLDAHFQVATALFFGKKYDECRKKLDFILTKDTNNIDALVLLANLDLATNNLKAALQVVDKTIKLKPADDRLQILRAAILKRDRKYELAEQALKKAISLKPKSLNNYRTLATFYLSQKKIERAADVFVTMVKSVPDVDKPSALLMQAGFYEIVKKPAKAEETLNSAVSLFPKDSNLRVAVAEFYQRRKDFVKAEESYKKAIAMAEKPANIEGLLANFYFEFGKFKQAEEMVKKTLATDKGNLNGLIIKAKLMVRDKKYNEALDLINNVLKGRPRSAEANFVKALAYYGKQNFDLATAAALEAVKYEPAHYRARLLLADMYLKDKAVDDAKQEAVDVLRLDGGNVQAALILAKCMVLEKDYEKARNLLGQIEKALPADPRAYQVMGVSYLGEGRLDAALGQFNKVLQLAPQSDAALGYIAGVLVKQGKKEAAMQRIKVQAAKFPKNAPFQVQQGLMAMSLQDDALAEQSFRAAIKLAPQLSTPYIMLGAILQKTGKVDEAIAQYKAALAENAALTKVRMQLGILLENQGQDKAAAEQFRKILAVEPDFAPAANNLAWYMANHDNDLGEALRLAMVAKSGAPDDPYVADTVGWVHYKRGSYGLARTQFEQAQQKLAESPTVNYHLALTLAKLDDKKQAKVFLQKAISLAGDSIKVFPDLAAAKKLLETL